MIPKRKLPEKDTVIALEHHIDEFSDFGDTVNDMPCVGRYSILLDLSYMRNQRGQRIM
jgi:hypothetical protein